MCTDRRLVFYNPSLDGNLLEPVDSLAVQNFHSKLPKYQPTNLTLLPQLAKELGLAYVFVKDEGYRLGLPSFKILGASWGMFRAITSRLGCSTTISIEGLKEKLKTKSVTIFTATDGNHGRAVAFMANLLGVKAVVLVPAWLDQLTRQLIVDEGHTTLVEYPGDYDQAVAEAARLAENTSDGILVQDTSSPGYEEIPNWIVQGYSTMLREIDSRLAEMNLRASAIITPVGVGSLAQAVVQHYKSRSASTKIVTVEPDNSACLYQSLQEGHPLSIQTSETIMSGMNCGTVSYTAFDLLRRNVDASLTVSDLEAHAAVKYLKDYGVKAGPCGASTIAALRRVVSSNAARLGLDENTVVLLLNTEGPRPYPEPKDVEPQGTHNVS